jgi:ABC-type nitrate/sulfonate/bicarbonate transport system permease component
MSRTVSASAAHGDSWANGANGNSTEASPKAASTLSRAVAYFLNTRLSGVCLVIALLLLWESSVRFGMVQSLNWPAFSAVLSALYRNTLSGELATVIGATLWVMARGYAIGCISGIVLGFAVALWRPMRLTLEPAIDILRTIPVTAVIPPLIFIFGLGDPLKIFSISFAIVFPMILNTMSGVMSIDPIYAQVARTFGLSRTRTFFRVVLPATMPFIMAGLRLSLGLALVVTVVSEMLAGSGGVGYYLTQMQYALRPADMYAAIIFLAVVAYSLNRLFLLWEARVIHWARTREATWSADP